jgi:Right handed beta helix region
MRSWLLCSLMIVGCGSSSSKTAGKPDLLAPQDDLGAPDDLHAPDDLLSPIDMSMRDSLETPVDQSLSSDMEVPPDFSPMLDFAPAAGTYVDAVHGSDTTGNGTVSMPFQHLHKAATVATSGQTIWAFPGSYGFDTAFVQLADGVGLQAITSGTVTVTTQVTFTGSGFASGILFDQTSVYVSAGVVDLKGVRFNRAVSGSGAAGIQLTGTGKVVLTPGGVTNYLGDAATVNFAQLKDSSRLEIYGGAFRDSGSSFVSNDWLFSVVDSSSMLLDGVTVERCHVNGIQIYDWAKLTLQNQTVMHNCAQDNSSANYTSIYMGSSGASPTPSPSVILDNSTITWASPSPAPTQSTIGITAAQNVTFVPSITVRNGSVIELNKLSGIQMFGSLGKITIDNSRVSDNGADGVRMSIATSAQLSVTGTSSITRNLGSGISLGNTGVYQAKIRNAQLTNNTSSGFLANGIDVTSTVDLGKSGDLGGNTLTGNAVASTTDANVRLVAAGNATYYAVGNTWTPSLQGTDGSGHYTGAGQTLLAPNGTPFGFGSTAPNVSMIDNTTSATLQLVVGP